MSLCHPVVSFLLYTLNTSTIVRSGVRGVLHDGDVGDSVVFHITAHTLHRQ